MAPRSVPSARASVCAAMTLAVGAGYASAERGGPTPRNRTAGPGHAVVYNIATRTTTVLPAPTGAFLPASGAAGNIGADENPAVANERALHRVFNALTALAPGDRIHPAYRPHCKVISRFLRADGVTTDDYHGSGLLIGDQIVLTAAHNFHNTKFGTLVGVWVYPAWNGAAGGVNVMPDFLASKTVIQDFGYSVASMTLANEGWTRDRSDAYDIGVLGINQRAVGVVTGYYGWSSGGTCEERLNDGYFNVSWPAEICANDNAVYDGSKAYFWSGSFEKCDATTYTLNTSGECYDAIWIGMSGSAGYYLNQSHDSIADCVVRGLWSVLGTHIRGYFCRLFPQLGAAIPTMRDTWRGNVIDVQVFQLRFEDTDPNYALDKTRKLATVPEGGTLPAAKFIAKNTSTATPGVANYDVEYYIAPTNRITNTDTLIDTITYNAMAFAPDITHSKTVPAKALPAAITARSDPYWVGVIFKVPGDANPANNTTITWDAQPVLVTAKAKGACIEAPDVGEGRFAYDLTSQTNDFASTCAGTATAEDVWLRYTPSCSGTATASTCDSPGSGGTVLSVLAACAGPELVCNSAPCGALGAVSFPVSAGVPFLIRIARLGSGSYDGFVDITLPPAETGACCSGSVCFQIGTFECAGTFSACSVCTSDTCPSACCTSSSCTLTPGAGDCAFIGGTYYAGFSCTLGPCESQKGACCVGAACQALSRQACFHIGSAFAGEGTVCNSPTSVSPCCRADFNSNGMVSPQDLFSFLAAYFAQEPTADVNPDGNITVQDVFHFLAAWFAKCA